MNERRKEARTEARKESVDPAVVGSRFIHSSSFKHSKKCDRVWAVARVLVCSFAAYLRRVWLDCIDRSTVQGGRGAHSEAPMQGKK